MPFFLPFLALSTLIPYIPYPFLFTALILRFLWLFYSCAYLFIPFTELLSISESFIYRPIYSIPPFSLIIRGGFFYCRFFFLIATLFF
jgi:hypothetical protein